MGGPLEGGVAGDAKDDEAVAEDRAERDHGDEDDLKVRTCN